MCAFPLNRNIMEQKSLFRAKKSIFGFLWVSLLKTSLMVIRCHNYKDNYIILAFSSMDKVLKIYWCWIFVTSYCVCVCHTLSLLWKWFFFFFLKLCNHRALSDILPVINTFIMIHDYFQSIHINVQTFLQLQKLQCLKTIAFWKRK